jgi:uncharacterized protein YggE
MSNLPVRLATAALLLAAPAPALRAQQPSPPPAPAVPGFVSTIAVSGQGEATVVPDRARLSIGVQTQAATAADASSRNAALQRAVIDAIRGQGVAADQITTSGYNVFPEQTYDQATRRSRITGYNVQNTVTVELRQTAQVGPVLDAVLARGANLVSSLQFYSSRAEDVRRQALQNAVQRARADADAMAAAAGGRLGDLVELTSDVSGGPRPMVQMDFARSRAAAVEATPVSEGTQTVNATVSARWRFLIGR